MLHVLRWLVCWQGKLCLYYCCLCKKISSGIWQVGIQTYRIQCCFFRHYTSLEEFSKVLYIVMAILPVLWTIGLLPPLDALFPWLAEQVLVFVLGGTYMASDSR